MKKFFICIERFILLPLLSLVIMFAWMFFDKDPPGKVGKEIHATADNEYIYLTYIYYRYRFCDVNVYRQLIKEGMVFTLLPVHVPSNQVEAMQIKHRDIVHQILPRMGGSLGPMTLRVTLDYQCNLLQKITPLRVEYELNFTPVEK